MNVLDAIQKYWRELQPRERLVLGWGGLLVALILFYALILQPWHRAISSMESALPNLRGNLVWMRQQAELIESGVGLSNKSNRTEGGQSLLSVLEKTAKDSKVQGAIVQVTPGQSGREVRVVLEDVNFNQWVRWVDILFQQYDVRTKQVSAERDEDRPNIAEIRVIFERS